MEMCCVFRLDEEKCKGKKAKQVFFCRRPCRLLLRTIRMFEISKKKKKVDSKADSNSGVRRESPNRGVFNRPWHFPLATSFHCQVAHFWLWRRTKKQPSCFKGKLLIHCCSAGKEHSVLCSLLDLLTSCRPPTSVTSVAPLSTSLCQRFGNRHSFHWRLTRSLDPQLI